MRNSKILLLTGAGFSKNFGGLLADEMWAMIFNHKEAQESAVIRNNMLSEFNYETVYQKIIDDNSVDEKEKAAIKKALLAAYEYQENNWQNRDYFLFMDDKILNHLGKFISDYVSMYFTLNHDLFLEKKMLHKFGGRRICLLANPSDVGTPDGRSALPNENEMLAKKSIIDDQLSRALNLCYVKLHGSINWLDSRRKETLVIVGGNKKEKMKNEPMLNQYYEIFKGTLLDQEQRLLVIGYGFMDNHINEAILEGLNKKALKLHIIDTLSPKDFSKKMGQNYRKGMSKKERDGEVIREFIWLKMSGYFPVKSLLDLFTVNGPTPLYRKLIENMELN